MIISNYCKNTKRALITVTLYAIVYLEFLTLQKNGKVLLKNINSKMP